jgi:signal peptidase I
MTEYKVGDRVVFDDGEPGVIVGVLGDGNELWEYVAEGEEYLVEIDSDLSDSYFATPSDLVAEVTD